VHNLKPMPVPAIYVCLFTNKVCFACAEITPMPDVIMAEDEISSGILIVAGVTL